MDESFRLISKYWESEYCSKIDTSGKFSVPNHFKKMAGLMAPGKSYYYIANFHTLELELVSESVEKFVGKPADVVNMNHLLSLALPEEIEKIHLKEQVINKFYTDFLPKDEILNYKVIYTYLLKDFQGQERTILHQATVLSMNEVGRFVHVFSIHSDISHLSVNSSSDVSFINIEGGESYYNIDSSTGNFNPNCKNKKENLRILLSKRELEIVKELSLGYSTVEIADRLHISSHTVQTHRKNILKKTDSKNTTQLISNCLAEGLITP